MPSAPEYVTLTVSIADAELERLTSALGAVRLGEQAVEVRWSGALSIRPDPKHPDMLEVQLRVVLR